MFSMERFVCFIRQKFVAGKTSHEKSYKGGIS
jgi:hypothetical protein